MATPLTASEIMSEIMMARTNQDVADEPSKPQVDVVFFLDTSGSMLEHTSRLLNSIGDSIRVLDRGQLDYHFGLLVTPHNGSEEDFFSGRIINFITPNTSDGIFQLTESIKTKTGIRKCPDEHFFSTLFFGFNPYSTLNQNFLRPDAFLAIILVTNSFDQSSRTYSNSRAFRALLSIKNDDFRKVLGYGAIAYPEFFGDNCHRENVFLNFLLIFSIF